MKRKVEKKTSFQLEDNGFLNLPRQVLKSCLFPYLSPKELGRLAQSNRFFKETIYQHPIKQDLTFQDYILKKQKLKMLKTSHRNNHVHIKFEAEGGCGCFVYFFVLAPCALLLGIGFLVAGWPVLMMGIGAGMLVAGVAGISYFVYSSVKKVLDEEKINDLQTQLQM